MNSKRVSNKTLQRVSLLVSTLALLYLLFTNVYFNTFVFRDWVVVFADLSVKTFIEYVLLKRPEREQ